MPRCNLTLKQKAQLIELSKELSTGQLAKKFRVHTTTVTRTIRKKDRILQQASRVNPNFKTVQTNLRSEEHDTLILEYIKNQQAANRPISVSDICDKAVEYAEALGRGIKSHRAWWRRFRVRCNVVRSKLTRDEKPKASSKKRTKATSWPEAVPTTTTTTTTTSSAAQEQDGGGKQLEVEVNEVVELLKDTVRGSDSDKIKSETYVAQECEPMEVDLVTIELPANIDISEVNHDDGLPAKDDAGRNQDDAVEDGSDSAAQPIGANEDLTVNSKLRASAKRNGPNGKGSSCSSVPKKTKKASPKKTSKQPKNTTTKANKSAAKKTDNSPVITDKHFTFKVRDASAKGSTTRSSSDAPSDA